MWRRSFFTSIGWLTFVLYRIWWFRLALSWQVTRLWFFVRIWACWIAFLNHWASWRCCFVVIGTMIDLREWVRLFFRGQWSLFMALNRNFFYRDCLGRWFLALKLNWFSFTILFREVWGLLRRAFTRFRALFGLDGREFRGLSGCYVLCTLIV